MCSQALNVLVECVHRFWRGFATKAAAAGSVCREVGDYCSLNRFERPAAGEVVERLLQASKLVLKRFNGDVVGPEGGAALPTSARQGCPRSMLTMNDRRSNLRKHREGPA